jgi:cystinosin
MIWTLSRHQSRVTIPEQTKADHRFRDPYFVRVLSFTMRSRTSGSSPERQSSSSPLLTQDDRNTSNGARDSDDENESQAATVRTGNPLRYFTTRRTLSLLASPLTDDRGHWHAVAAGLSTMLVAGTALGLALPKNPVFTDAWYRSFSSCLGYTYFLCWSVSFYPQIMTNFRRKCTAGLSPDFCVLNVLGFVCYGTYCTAMYGSAHIQALYRARHGADAEITVQSNDVAFALHAVLMASVTLFQIGYYGGFRSQQPSKLIGSVIVGILVVALSGLLLVWMGAAHNNVLSASMGFRFDWLDYLYLLSYVKIFITFIKYVPQVVLNHQRKSTTGFSVWQILLDLSGGALSDMQLIGDCMELHDWSGLTGNLAKFFLGFVSIVFDTIILMQHYVLFPDTGVTSPNDTMPTAEEEALMSTTRDAPIKQDEESQNETILVV